MFAQACVKNFVHKVGVGVAGGACMVGGHAWQAVCVAGGHVWQGACVVGGIHGRGYAWQGVCVAGGHAWWGVCMAGDTATAVDGTYPTGMHSCYL